MASLTHRSYYRKCSAASRPCRNSRTAYRLRTLADVVEPVKDYTREASAPAEPTSATH